MLKLPNLQILDVGGQDLLRTIKHMREFDHLSPSDAIHLATMTEHGIHSIVSEDADFDHVDSVERIPLDDLDSFL